MAKQNGNRSNKGDMPNCVGTLVRHLENQLGPANVKFIGSVRQFGTASYKISGSPYNPLHAIEVFVKKGNDYYKLAVMGDPKVTRPLVESAIITRYL